MNANRIRVRLADKLHEWGGTSVSRRFVSPGCVLLAGLQTALWFLGFCICWPARLRPATVQPRSFLAPPPSPPPPPQPQRPYGPEPSLRASPFSGYGCASPFPRIKSAPPRQETNSSSAQLVKEASFLSFWLIRISCPLVAKSRPKQRK